MNKSGFNPKLTSEKVLYVIIIIIIALFIFNMKGVYSLASKIKTGELFKSTTKTTTTDTSKDDSKSDDTSDTTEYTVVKPVGDDKVSCTLKTDSATGSKTDVVYLYYTDSKLTSLDEEISYAGLTSEYTNYIYSERKIYEKRKSDNLKLEGYSVVTTLSGTLSLTVSTVVDLSKTDLTKITISDTNGIGLYGVYNQDINEAETQYAALGYECE